MTAPFRIARAYSIRCARTCALSVGCALLLTGCPDVPGTPDGGAPPADAPPGAGRLEAMLTADAEGLEDGSELEILRVAIGELRARNDRGGDLEPAVRQQVVDLVTGGTLVLDGAVPATYGRVTMVLEPVGGVPSFELRVTDSEGTLHVLDDGAIDVDVRCDGPVSLEPGETVALDLTLELGELAAVLREAPLPDAEDGVVTVTPVTAPEAIAAIEAELRTRWDLGCAEESGAEALEIEH